MKIPTKSNRARRHSSQYKWKHSSKIAIKKRGRKAIQYVPSAYSNSEAEIYPSKAPSLTIQNPPSLPPTSFNHSTFSLNTRAAISFPPFVTSIQFRGSSDCGVHKSANVEVKIYRFLESR